MASPAYATFRQAVLDRKQVTCTYQGRYREVCPHAVGWKDGQEKVLVYQFGGQSSQALPPGGEWRCLFVNQVRNAQSRDGNWYTGHSHLEPQTCVDDIDLEVRY